MDQPKATLLLAPASGAGLGKVLFSALLADEKFLPSMVAAARGGLTAVYPRRWDKHLDDWGEPEPDHKTRVQTFLALWAQAEGEPVKRLIHQHLGVSVLDPMVALESPATRDAMRRLLEKADNAKNRQAHKRPRAVERAAEAAVEEPAGPASVF